MTQVSEFPVLTKTSDPIFKYSEREYSNRAIIVDNGSYECRAGWSSDSLPRMTFKNITTKIRGKKGSDIYVGNDIANPETSGWMPMKSPYEKNVVTHPEVQENVFDHIFCHLGLADKSSIDHSVVITEPVCNPNYYRQYISELLFECYRVSSILYGVDGLLSLRRNLPNVENALVLSLGYSTCHVIPFVENVADMRHAKRISLGGYNVSAYVQRLLQLKQPHLAAGISPIRAEYLTQTYSYYPKDYDEEMLKWLDPEYAENNTIRIQMSYNALQTPASSSGSSNKMDVCVGLLRKVQAAFDVKRQATLVEDEERLQQLLSIQEYLQTEDEPTTQKTLQELGYSDVAEFKMIIDELQNSVDQARSKENRVVDIVPDPKQFPDPEVWIHAVDTMAADLRQQKNKLDLRQSSLDEMLDVCDRAAVANRLAIVHMVLTEARREFKKSLQSQDFFQVSSGLAEYYQLQMGTERVRCPESLFQPCLLGVTQMGLVETAVAVLSVYDHQKQTKMAENVFVCGGPASAPGIKERVFTELRSYRPADTLLNVYVAENTTLDAWRGAQQLGADEAFMRENAVTRALYEEHGPDYITKHFAANLFSPSPLVVRL